MLMKLLDLKQQNIVEVDQRIYVENPQIIVVIEQFENLEEQILPLQAVK